MAEWEFEEVSGDWTIRGNYKNDKNIEFLYKGEHFDYLTYPSYKIWNIPAHIEDYMQMAETERLKRAAK